MSCSVSLKGIPATCSTNVGGIREVYICNYDDVKEITVSDGEPDTGKNGMITKITLNTGAKFNKYFFKKNTSSSFGCYKLHQKRLM